MMQYYLGSFFSQRIGVVLLLLLLTFTSTLSHAVKPFSSFEKALPGYTYHFPKDHASHSDFKTEWWYYTGHLKANAPSRKKSERWFGYELTFFRVAQHPEAKSSKPNMWSFNTFYMAHFAITDDTEKQFYHTQKFNRDTPYRAGADTQKYHVWNEDWEITQQANKSHQLKAAGSNFSINLNVVEAKPSVIHGKNGVSQKASCVGCASHYYSFTRMPSQGEITIDGQHYSVVGESWMDHEFGSNQLQKNQTGWDWFSIQLDNHHELMLYKLRLKNNAIEPNSSGTWVLPNGTSEHLNLDEVTIKPINTWKSKKTGGIYPSGWILSYPKKNLQLTVTPTLKNQELTPPYAGVGVAYWEGRCNVTGTYQGKPTTGHAYVELTGYDKPFEQSL